MVTLRPASQRGHADHGWLNTHHTFSFAGYYDEAHLGFGALRVLNDDRVAPGTGFGAHPHRDMEIVSYVLDGALAHRDSMGNGSVIRAGDVQRMSAGTGVVHSEGNALPDRPVHFLQLWFLPRRRGLTPSYEQRTVPREAKLGRLALVASPEGADGAVRIESDARLYATVLPVGASTSLTLPPGRRAWVHVARGQARLNGQALGAGDGAAVEQERELTLEGVEEAEVLVFEVG